MNDLDEFKEPVFKGCTAPALVFGVPMLPFILGTMLFLQLALIALVALGLAGLLTVVLLYLPGFFWARRLSKDDEHRLLQMLMRMRMRGPHKVARSYWGAITFSPFDYTRK